MMRRLHSLIAEPSCFDWQLVHWFNPFGCECVQRGFFSPFQSQGSIGDRRRARGGGILARAINCPLTWRPLARRRPPPPLGAGRRLELANGSVPGADEDELEERTAGGFAGGRETPGRNALTMLIGRALPFTPCVLPERTATSCHLPPHSCPLPPHPPAC